MEILFVKGTQACILKRCHLSGLETLFGAQLNDVIKSK